MGGRLTFEAMDEDDFQAYMSAHQEEYIRDRMRVDRLAEADARTFVHRQHAELLPEGSRTPGHYFYSLVDSGRSLKVGSIWFQHRVIAEEIYIYHLLVRPEERRKGFASEALDLLADLGKSKGCKSIWLNVFAHNQGAKAVYEGNGFELATMHMCRHL